MGTPPAPKTACSTNKKATQLLFICSTNAIVRRHCPSSDATLMLVSREVCNFLTDADGTGNGLIERRAALERRLSLMSRLNASAWSLTHPRGFENRVSDVIRL